MTFSSPSIVNVTISKLNSVLNPLELNSINPVKPLCFVWRSKVKKVISITLNILVFIFV